MTFALLGCDFAPCRMCLTVHDGSSLSAQNYAMRSSIDEWLASAFDPSVRRRLPLADEPFVAVWRRYQSANVDLTTRLVQLQFPVREGMHTDPLYRAVTRQGVQLGALANAPTLKQSITRCLHQTVVGHIPVLTTAERSDFVQLVQALAFKNEPVPIADSQGACMVAGYNNWDRIWAYRTAWEQAGGGDWSAEFRQLQKDKSRYQDRFLILCRWPYSGISADTFDLSPTAWLDLSHTIRLHHEAAHYLTKRVYGAMRRHIHDELLADYAGVVAAIGRFRADWFLRFMGLHRYPTYRTGGRLQNYLSDEMYEPFVFNHICETLIRAAHNVESFDQALAADRHNPHVLLALAETSLSELAQPDGAEQVMTRFQRLMEEKCEV